MTIFEKLFQTYPHKKTGFLYEFVYREHREDGTIRATKFCTTDPGTEFVTTKDGKDYTTGKIKPRTKKALMVGMTHLKVDTLKPVAPDDTIQRVFEGILLKIATMRVPMESPIHIEVDTLGDLTTTKGYCYVTDTMGYGNKET